jgi:hypothetical protein
MIGVDYQEFWEKGIDYEFFMFDFSSFGSLCSSSEQRICGRNGETTGTSAGM